MNEKRRMARQADCSFCGHPLDDHFDANNAFVGCRPLSRLFVTVAGRLLILHTAKDAYRAAALDRRHRAQLAAQMLERSKAIGGVIDGVADSSDVFPAAQLAPQVADPLIARVGQ
jgi:hypothetical protein